MEPMGAAKCNEAFEENLREYPGEKYPKKKQEWMSVQGGSILTICKLHPTQRPPMVRPEDDNELGQQDVEVRRALQDCARAWGGGAERLAHTPGAMRATAVPPDPVARTHPCPHMPRTRRSSISC